MNQTRSPRAAINAVVFASTVGFMGIGLVDPILIAIAEGLHATPSEVSLLFTSYFLITAVMMLITDIVATRIGLKNSIMLGAFIVAVFALGSGTSQTVEQLVGYRSGWGLGNALFVATALTLIVTLSQKKGKESVRLYEAALGVGIAIGPLIGAILGKGSWRYPFWGTALLMLIGFVSIAYFVPATPVKHNQRHALSAPFQALQQPKLRLISLSAFFYNFVFFAILAYSPFVLDLGVLEIGAVFFGWGIALAITSTLITPRWQSQLHPVSIVGRCQWVLVVLMLIMGYFSMPSHFHRAPLVIAIIISGGLFGVVNTLFTELALETHPNSTSIASAAYNFVRWLGGAIAPILITHIGEHYGSQYSFLLAAVFALIACFIISKARLPKPQISHPLPPLRATVSGRRRPVMILMDGSDSDDVAINYARQFLHPNNHRLLLVTVNVVEGVEGEGVREGPSQALGRLKEYFKQLSDHGFDVTSEAISDVLPVQVAKTIVGRGRALDAELLLMVKHSHATLLNRALSFSVTQEVTEQSHCPVLVIPSGSQSS
ncbi:MULTISPECIES: MFS transporter [Vibrio]|uniref:MFS transporter n=1 Tax=Vibrio coralliilyticus TaxID=190893 RepID=A0AAE5ERI5_9VIBR|nr:MULTISPECIES: MFS transporter [Vibrio]AIW22737.1 MFS transporter [Vibrio coralliilyticus]MCM5510976.1 MFS transporter [Vibrio sp. SCSIO 43169]NOH38239.1 MFS transporter [Vibrio coralliilyticus]NOH55048.1 MFS transporter [Vibrio coralliilyticus]NOI30388.1 MFS transporter [Vibrio coralliilyticus]